MKSITVQAWGQVYGKGSVMIIEMRCYSIADFIEYCEKEGHVLDSKPVIC